MITIIINGNKIKAETGKSVLEVAKENGIDIPALCYHSDLKPNASCRLCMIEIEGVKGLHASCSVKIEEGMKITTESKDIKRARKTNLELLFSQHNEECFDCVWKMNCKLLEFAKKYNIKISKFYDRKIKYAKYKFGPSILFDSTKCIDCRNCVDICHKQGVDYLEIKEKGSFFKIVPKNNKDCIYCGQCIIHCPAGAFEAVGEFEEIEKPLKDKNKYVVFQFAPSIRSSIGEYFDIPYGEIVTDKLVAGIKKLGVDKVFDVSVGADFTTVEEANELIERMSTKKGLPMFTSCCPAWVRFVELFYPEFISNLTTVRSPHIISGGLIKTYFAQKENIDPKDIVVVSIMPCTAKKYEITRNELKIDGIRPVDYVLTNRELVHLFKKRKIDLKKIKPQKADNPMGDPSGAGEIYGASGGVMESALRTVNEKLTGMKFDKIDFKEVRGQEGCKEANIKINGKTLKIAVINGTGNAKKLLKDIKKYDYVEVMACPGGCIGGGGQPVPTDKDIRLKRAQALYCSDEKRKIRLANQNPIVSQTYKEFLNNKEIIHKVCHTNFSKANRK